MGLTTEENEEKPDYPRLVVNNKFKIVFYFNQRPKMTRYYPEKKDCEEAASWVAAEVGQMPFHTIEEIL